MLKQITPIILSYNEEENLVRSLGALEWAQRVLVIDSGSTDRSLDICAKFANVEVIVNPFENFAQQCNFALQQNIQTQWVLSMDADYIVTEALRAELAALSPNNETQAFSISFTYLIDGVPLHGSLYPPRFCLYRPSSAHYLQDGHAHKVHINGKTSSLNEKLLHDDRKPYQRWLAAQVRYAEQEANKLRKSNWAALTAADKVRRVGLAPIIVWPFTFIVKGLIKDGRFGVRYCNQRFTAEWLLFKQLFISDR